MPGAVSSLRQSGERCALSVRRSHEMEEGGWDREQEALFHLSHYITQRFWVSKVNERTNIHQKPNLTYLHFPLYVFFLSFFPLPLPICISLSVSCSVSLANYHPACVCIALCSTQLHSFFISWKSSVKTLCVISPLLPVWFYLSLSLSPLCLPPPLPPPLAKLGARPAWQRCQWRAVFMRLIEWVNNIAPTPPCWPYLLGW